MEVCSSDEIDPGRAYGLIRSKGAGSVVLHYAVVKPMAGEGGTTGHIDYAAGGDVAAELRGIAQAMAAEFALEDVLLIRRTGRLGLGDIISLVAASAASSEDAFEACRQGLVRLKRMRTILKDEVFARV